jgi:hypothetical protein
VLLFTLTQVELECINLQLAIKSYETADGQYLLRLSTSRLVNTKVLSQRIFELYPEMFGRLVAQRQAILGLLDIRQNPHLKIELLTQPLLEASPAAPAVDHRRRMYQEVVTQIQRIIMAGAPEQCVDSVQRLVEFLKQQNISTEEIQKRVIVQAARKRANNDQIFQKQLLNWEETAPEAARFSIVGQAVRLAIALILSEAPHP